MSLIIKFKLEIPKYLRDLDIGIMYRKEQNATHKKRKKKKRENQYGGGSSSKRNKSLARFSLWAS